jgi:hypothetical protein
MGEFQWNSTTEGFWTAEAEIKVKRGINKLNRDYGRRDPPS